MRRSVCAIFFVLAAVSAWSQRADVEVSYEWHFFNRTGKEVVRKMTLLAGAEKSKFYDKMGEFVDSMRSTPDGLRKYGEMAKAYLVAGDISSLPKKDVYLYVFKDIADSTVTVYDGIEQISDYRFCSREPLEMQQWEIEPDSIKTVMGYDCVLATTNWRGRTWKAWFAPELPVTDGPWKLCGLPGLILDAEDSTGQHRFLATGLENSQKQITGGFGLDKYEKLPRVEMLKILRRYDVDPIGTYNAVSDGAFSGYHSSEISPMCDFPETDYK